MSPSSGWSTVDEKSDILMLLSKSRDESHRIERQPDVFTDVRRTCKGVGQQRGSMRVSQRATTNRLGDCIETRTILLCDHHSTGMQRDRQYKQADDLWIVFREVLAKVAIEKINDRLCV